jgi:hypothetical protein
MKKQWDDVPSASEYDVLVGIDPGLCYVFIGKNNENADSKKETVRMSSKQYYHDCRFNWKVQKEQRCYKKINNRMDYSSNMPSNKTNDINELQHYLCHALNGLDMTLQLHVINPFQKWKHKTYIFKQRTFHKILQMIMMKQTKRDPKKVIISFGNWGNPRDSIIRGHRRGPVKEIQEKLKKWYELVDVNEF